MKTMEITGAWGLENIQAATRPDPKAGPGEVVIGIQAVSFNRDLITIHPSRTSPHLLHIQSKLVTYYATAQNPAGFIVTNLAD